MTWFRKKEKVRRGERSIGKKLSGKKRERANGNELTRLVQGCSKTRGGKGFGCVVGHQGEFLKKTNILNNW